MKICTKRFKINWRCFFWVTWRSLFCIVTVTVRHLLLYFCVKLSRYSSLLKEARDFGIKKGLMTGLGIGFFQLVIYGSYALAFWYVWGLFYLFFIYMFSYVCLPIFSRNLLSKVWTYLSVNPPLIQVLISPSFLPGNKHVALQTANCISSATGLLTLLVLNFLVCSYIHRYGSTLIIDEKMTGGQMLIVRKYRITCYFFKEIVQLCNLFYLHSSGVFFSHVWGHAVRSGWATHGSHSCS